MWYLRSEFGTVGSIDYTALRKDFPISSSEVIVPLFNFLFHLLQLVCQCLKHILQILRQLER